MIIKNNIMPKDEDVLKLYEDVKWHAYTKDPTTLMKAIENSLKVWTVWEKETLIALARVVGDGHTIIYIQDILVLEEFQNKGLGSKLLKIILDEYQSVRQILLLTDNTEKSKQFYKKNGLVSVDTYDAVAFMK